MANRTLIITMAICLLSSCSYNLDPTGVVYAPVPVNERFELSREWSEINPAREISIPGDAYYVSIAGDAHVGGTDNLNLFINSAVEGGAAMIAIAGDASSGREDDFNVLASELEGAGELPVCLVPGNHDLYFGGWESFYRHFGAFNYTFRVITDEASDLYIFLDTGGGTLGQDQLEWLKKVLEEQRGQCRHAVVVTHVNFFRNRFTGSTNILNEEILLLLDLFARYRIEYVIQGHDHKRYEEIFGSCTYITLDALLDGYKYASWLELAIDGDDILYNFVEI